MVSTLVPTPNPPPPALEQNGSKNNSLDNFKVSQQQQQQQQGSAVKDFEKLLQDMDVNRLRAVIYRDVVSCNRDTVRVT